MPGAGAARQGAQRPGHGLPAGVPRAPGRSAVWLGAAFPPGDRGQVSAAPRRTLGQGCGVGSARFHVGSQQEGLSCGCQLDSGQPRALAGPEEGGPRGGQTRSAWEPVGGTDRQEDGASRSKCLRGWEERAHRDPEAIRYGLGGDTGRKGPLGGDGKPCPEPAFAPLSPGSRSLIRSSIQLPARHSGIVLTPQPPPRPLPAGNRVLTKEALRDGPERTEAQGLGRQGHSLCHSRLPHW